MQVGDGMKFPRKLQVVVGGQLLGVDDSAVGYAAIIADSDGTHAAYIIAIVCDDEVDIGESGQFQLYGMLYVLIA